MACDLTSMYVPLPDTSPTVGPVEDGTADVARSLQDLLIYLLVGVVHARKPSTLVALHSAQVVSAVPIA